MSNAKERDREISVLLRELATKAVSGKPRVGPEYPPLIKKLFSTDTWGFRELLLVILVARILDDGYRASKALYECNPRALYEGPIREWLIDLSIPHRKSGPLNIAKATRAITGDWAAQRRPQDVAEALVQIVERVDSQSRSSVFNLAVFVCGKFLEEAQQAKQWDISPDPLEDPLRISEICIQMIDKAPDGGNTPQRICGLLLKAYHVTLRTGIQVQGHEDRASTTSTTSKKPGDFVEADAKGKIFTVYEVTAKPFGHQRVAESADTLRQYAGSSGTSVREVHVLCRASDVHPDAKDVGRSQAYLGRIDHSGVSYFFIDVYEWIRDILLRIPAEGRKSFFSELNEYVSHPDTAMDVKRVWSELNAQVD